MRLFYPLSLAIAIKYSFNSKAHKFASFVAILSTIGIAIGVCALIIDTSIMQGLENKLKDSVLDETPHVVVECTSREVETLLQHEQVIAAAPFVQAQTLMQGVNSLSLINLQGLDDLHISYKKGYQLQDLKLEDIPTKGSFELNAEALLYINNDLKLNSRVKLISTVNARYTPMGLTPTQRIFTLKKYHPSANSAALSNALGNYDDVRRFFRMPYDAKTYRLWLLDPFKIEEVRDYLTAHNFRFTDWTLVQGEFFKAVAMEKLTMSIMLCLVIIVAAFNILSALAMTVSARLTEIAVLKTLGLSNLRILKIFLIMGAFSGIIGTLGGIITGIPLSYYLSDLMSHTGSFGTLPADIEAATVVMIGAGSILMSLICTLYPAIKASAADPVSHLNRG